MIDLKGEVGHDVIVPRSSLKSRDDRGTIKGRSPSIVGGPGFSKTKHFRDDRGRFHWNGWDSLRKRPGTMKAIMNP